MESVSELDQIKPQEWNNIPDVIKSAIHTVVQHLKLNKQSNSNQSSSIRKLETSVTSKLKSFKKTFQEIESRIDPIEPSLVDKIQEVKNQIQSQIYDAGITSKRLVDAQAKRITELQPEFEALREQINVVDEKYHEKIEEIKEQIQAQKLEILSEIQDGVLGPAFAGVKEQIEIMNNMQDTLNEKIQTNWDAVRLTLSTTIHKRYTELKTELAEKFKESSDNLQVLKEICGEYPVLLTKHEKHIDKMLVFQRYLDEKIELDVKEAKEQMTEFTQHVKEDSTAYCQKIEAMIDPEAISKLDDRITKVHKEIDERYTTKIKKVKPRIVKAIEELDSKTTETTAKIIEDEMSDLRQKLAWLPSEKPKNAVDMNPTEARLYAMETRIREEMKFRIQDVKKIYSVMNVKMPITQSEIENTEGLIESLNSSPDNIRSTPTRPIPTPPRGHGRHHSALPATSDHILPSIENTHTVEISPDTILRPGRARKKFTKAFGSVLHKLVKPNSGRKATASLSPTPDKPYKMGNENFANIEDQTRPTTVLSIVDEPVPRSRQFRSQTYKALEPSVYAQGELITVNTMPMPQTSDASTMIISQPKVLTKVRFTEEHSQT